MKTVDTNQAEVEPRDDSRSVLALTALVCAAAAVVWIGAVARSAGRGFDISDEGYYLLSYRWWSTHFRNFTGAQYLYGPIFQVLGYSIRGLRLFRLFTNVAVDGVLAFTLMRWLRERRPKAPRTPLWELAGGAAVVATGGVVYGWLPLSPGYNDVSLLGCLLGASVALRAATYVDRGVEVPKWVPIAFGPVIVCSLIAKWASSGLSVAVVAVTLAIVLAPRGLREIGRFALWTVVSMALTALFIHVFIVRAGTAIPPLIAMNKAIATSGNAIGPLLDLYWTTGKELFERIWKRESLLAVAAVIAVVGRGPALQRAAALLAVVGIANAYAELDAHRGTTGGNPSLREYSAGLIGSVLVALSIGVLVVVTERVRRLIETERAKRAIGATSASATASASTARSVELSSLSRDGLRGWAVLAMLAILPIAQGMGTGNPLYFMAINGFAAWMAILVAVVTGVDAAPSTARWMTTVAGAASVMLAANVGSTGIRLQPYRATPYAQATDVAGGVPALASLRLSPSEAASYSSLRSMLQTYVEPPGRAMMAFDEAAGMVLALDGQPVGEAWYSASDYARTGVGITSECLGKKPYWGSRLPILLFRRNAVPTDLAAFEVCGLSLSDGYRALAPAQATMGFTVYVPVGEDAKDPP